MPSTVSRRTGECAVTAIQIGVGPVEVRGAAEEKALHLVEVARSGARCNLQNFLARFGLNATRRTPPVVYRLREPGHDEPQRWPAGCEDIKPPPAKAHLAGTFLLFGRPKPGFGHRRPARHF